MFRTSIIEDDVKDECVRLRRTLITRTTRFLVTRASIEIATRAGLAGAFTDFFGDGVSYVWASAGL